MPQISLGPRLYFDETRQNYVIRDGRIFIRTGAAGWRMAQDRLNEYLKTRPVNLPAPKARPPGFIYFITADFVAFPIKIGFTQKLNSLRTKGLQTGCPYPLLMLGTMPGTYADERKLHKRFAGFRLQGEWFERSPELMEVINGTNS